MVTGPIVGRLFIYISCSFMILPENSLLLLQLIDISGSGEKQRIVIFPFTRFNLSPKTGIREKTCIHLYNPLSECFYSYPLSTPSYHWRLINDLAHLEVVPADYSLGSKHSLATSVRLPKSCPDSFREQSLSIILSKVTCCPGICTLSQASMHNMHCVQLNFLRLIARGGSIMGQAISQEASQSMHSLTLLRSKPTTIARLLFIQNRLCRIPTEHP